MTDTNHQTGAELLPHVIKFSEILSECVPHAWASKRYLYSTIFVRAADKKKQLPQTIDEFEQVWKENPLDLYTLLPNLVDMFGDSNDPNWRWVRGFIDSFYRRYNKDVRGSNSAATKKVLQRFRSLPSLYHSVRQDIRVFQENLDERSVVSQELLDELKEFRKKYPHCQCPVQKRYVTLAKEADPDVVWNVKEETFTLIYQRTRELFQFQNEEIHFHHAASIIDYWDAHLRKKHKPDTRNDEVAFENHANDLKIFQRLYVGILENSQKKLKVDEIVKYVTDKMKLSRKFLSVRNAANKDFDKCKKLLVDSSNDNYVLPPVVNSQASLASVVYTALYQRRKVYDDLQYTTDKIEKRLQQVQGWETMTGEKMLLGTAEQIDAVPPQGSVQNQDPALPSQH